MKSLIESLYLTDNKSNFNNKNNCNWLQRKPLDAIKECWPDKVEIAICKRGRGEHFFLPLSDYTELLQLLGQKSETKSTIIKLTGEDTLEHPYLFEMLQVNKTLGFLSELITDGELIDLSLTQALKGLVSSVIFSVQKAEEIRPDRMDMLLQTEIKVNFTYPYTQ